MTAYVWAISGYAMRSIVSGGEPSALIQNEVLALNDEERRALLQKTSRHLFHPSYWGSRSIAGLVIPWNKLRLLRRYTYNKQNIATIITHCLFQVAQIFRHPLAGEERMRQISRQIVGDNLKRELAPFFLYASIGWRGNQKSSSNVLFQSWLPTCSVMNTIIHRMQHIHKCNGMKSLKWKWKELGWSFKSVLDFCVGSPTPPYILFPLLQLCENHAA